MTDSSILKGMDLFQGLDSAALDAVLKSAQFRRTPKQTLIFSQGTPATTCHALIEGRIKIVQTGPDGEQVLIHFVGPGEMFGTPAVFLRTGYPADAVAITDCVNLQWSAKVMTDSMMKYPRIALNALGIVAARYQEAQHRLCEMGPIRRSSAASRMRCCGLCVMPGALSIITLRSTSRCYARTWLS
jgi:CRP-like cAMP-binding protein